MGVRLATNIMDALLTPFKKVNIVSDSEIALYWLTTSRTLPLFVNNQRDRIIKQKSAIESKGATITFYHVESAFNPADIGTRGSTAAQINDSAWIRGPQWLNNNQTSWPLKHMTSQMRYNPVDSHTKDAPDGGVQNSRKIDAEINQTAGEGANRETTALPTNPELSSDDNYRTAKGATNNEPIQSATIGANVNMVPPISPSVSIINLERFSQLNRALRALAYVGKSLKRWVERTNSARNTQITVKTIAKFSSESSITAEDIKMTTTMVLFASNQGFLMLQYLMIQNIQYGSLANQISVD
ncbi:hypothetical protein Aduo_000433 [Ancylostoma duodenale]